MNRWLNKLERMIQRVAIPNLMIYITGGMLLVFAMNFIMPALNVSSYLTLNRNLLFQGQVWRIITYLFLPPASGVLFVLLALYFYYMIGSRLESQWGIARFNLYYLIGMLGTTLAAIISGMGTNTYLNLSLFFAFAVIFPDFQVLLFFVLPVKIKYLAYLDAAFFAFSFVFALIQGQWYEAVAIVASLLNFFLFFGGDFIRGIKEKRQYSSTRNNYRRQMKNNDQWR